MQRTVRRQVVELNAGKQQAVAALSVAYGREKQYWLNIFAEKENWPFIKQHRKIRDAAVKEKYQSQYGLQGRLWKLALIDAAETWDKYYKAIFANVKSLIYKRADWSKEQRHYANWCLYNYENVSALLSHDTPEFPKGDLDLKSRKAICRWLYKTIRKLKGKQPSVKIKRSFVLDAQCYNVFEKDGSQYLSIMSLDKGKRIKLPLKGRTAISGNIRIVTTNDVVEAHIGFKLTEKVMVGKDEAVDLGFTEVMIDTDGNSYGDDLGKILTEATEVRHVTGKARNKLRALKERYQNSSNPKHRKKAKNIKQYNLGYKKWRQREKATKAAIACEVNQALNQLLRERQPGVLITENLRHAFTFNRPKSVNRRMSAWVKGFMQDRAEFKTVAEGFRHLAVNSAYGSQECNGCGYVDAKNRNGNAFKCTHCGHEDHADRNAARNYLRRMDDPEITLYTPYTKMKEILLDRFNRQLETEGKAKLAVGTSSGTGVTVQGKTPDTETVPSPHAPSMPTKDCESGLCNRSGQQQEGLISRSNLTVTRRAKRNRDDV